MLKFCAQLHGAICKIPEVKLSIKMEGIHGVFTPVTSVDQTQCSISIQIEGHPGFGRTTAAKELHLWCTNNRLNISDKLPLLMLRNCNIQESATTERLKEMMQSTYQVLYDIFNIRISVMYQHFCYICMLHQTNSFQHKSMYLKDTFALHVDSFHNSDTLQML